MGMQAAPSDAAAAATKKDEISANEGVFSYYDIVVIGGGVVGLAILRQATVQGYRACCVEAQSELLSGASGSNSGIVCTGVDAPVGSLERALIRDSISSIRTHCRTFRVPMRSEDRDCGGGGGGGGGGGSLVCSWPWDAATQDEDEEEENEDRLASVLQESHDAGDVHARRLTGLEVLALEPSLNPSCLGAIHIPGEIVIDPWLYAISLATHARENGAQIYTSFEVDPDESSLNEETGIWTLKKKKRRTSSTDTDTDTDTPSDTTASASASTPEAVRARAVVNATGAWSDVVQQKLVGSASWKIKPRRGQYCIFAAAVRDDCSTTCDDCRLLKLSRPIQPVPTDCTKGIFVFSTLYDQIVVGPTAQDQDSRDNTTPCANVRQQLIDTVQRVLPSLDTSGSNSSYVGEYVGIRPGTNHRDYQIHLNVAKRWVACAGIRSTGLTASLGIGRHVVYLLQQGVLPIVAQSPQQVQTTPLPLLQDLVNDFNQRNDDMVEIAGHLYKVTHPLTIHGWKRRTGLAAASIRT